MDTKHCLESVYRPQCPLYKHLARPQAQWVGPFSDHLSGAGGRDIVTGLCFLVLISKFVHKDSYKDFKRVSHSDF